MRSAGAGGQAGGQAGGLVETRCGSGAPTKLPGRIAELNTMLITAKSMAVS